jgi:hypothetical protein
VAYAAVGTVAAGGARLRGKRHPAGGATQLQVGLLGKVCCDLYCDTVYDRLQ